jgi:hypothetical protein
MFEFLFKYPAAVFSRGQFVLLAPWPVWVLVVAVLAAGGALAWHVSRHRGVSGVRPVMVAAGTALVALVLFLLAAITIATLRPQQNVVAVLVDDRAAWLFRKTAPRLAQAEKLLTAANWRASKEVSGATVSFRKNLGASESRSIKRRGARHVRRQSGRRYRGFHAAFRVGGPAQRRFG